MENEKRENEEHIRKIVEPIFNSAVSPQEDNKTQTLVGSDTDLKIEKRAWQPHNYRLYIDFSRANFHPPNQPTTNPPQADEGWVNLSNYSYKPVNFGKEHLFMNFHWCNILVKKNQVSVTHKLYGKQWFEVSYTEPEQYEAFIQAKQKERQEYCMLALRKFISIFGGRSIFKIIKIQKNDNSFAGDEVIDSLPQEFRINTELFKKDYKDKFEFKGIDPMLNYVYNQSLKKKEPEIREEIASLKTQVSENVAEVKKIDSELGMIKALGEENLKSTSLFRETIDMLRKDAVMPLKEQIELHLEVERGTKDNIAKDVIVKEKMLEVQAQTLKVLRKMAQKPRRRKPKRIDMIKRAYRGEFKHEYW
jgi:hypothetical protein